MSLIFTGMVEALAAKALNWENEKGVVFLYDGVSTYCRIDILNTIICTGFLPMSFDCNMTWAYHQPGPSSFYA